jgi:protein-disulfide isomerase
MSKRQEMREKRRRQQRNNRIFAIVLISVGAVVVVSLFVYSQYRPVGSFIIPTPFAHSQVDFNNMGDPNAPVKIVEFADFQCPVCGRWVTDVENAFYEEYVSTGKVLFTYRSMGNFIGPESQQSAEAVYCAGDQGKFWEYHDIVYANQNGENAGAFSDAKLKAFAGAIGLDTGAFNQCLSSGKYADEVTQDGLDGRQAGVTGTPSFLINGVLYPAYQTIDALRQTIDAELANSGPVPTP